MTLDRDRNALALRTPPDALADELEFEDIDPEKTLVREDWESTVIRRVASHVAAVQSSIAEDANGEKRFGWESEGLRRLARELQRSGK